MSDTAYRQPVSVEAPYRVQDGCWNCACCASEVGPDGSHCLRCMKNVIGGSTTMAQGAFVQEAGVCGKWQSNASAPAATLRTTDLWQT